MNSSRSKVGFLFLALHFVTRSQAKNISSCSSSSEILDYVLERSNYDKSIRPCVNKKPVVVYVNVFITSINGFRESDMEYDVQMYFRLTWQDERLKYENYNIEEQYITSTDGGVVNKIWTPDPYFDNELNGKRHNIMKRNEYMRLSPDGTILYSTRLTLTLSCPMNFRYFPMDKHICEIQISSYSITDKDLIYKWLTNDSETSIGTNELTLPQFTIAKIDTKSRTDQYTVGNFTGLTAYIHFHRRLSFYLTHNYIPALLVVIMSWLSLWIDRKSVPARITFAITTILTMTTLIIGVGQQGLPVVSYIKAIDWYYIGCFTFVFAALCEFTIVNYFDVEHRRKIEKHRVEQLLQKAKASEEEKSKDPYAKYGGLYGCRYDVENIPSGEEDEDENRLNLLQTASESPLSSTIERIRFYQTYYVIKKAY